MGRETKVGLLVGMCFIVCFAIILSRRGERRPDAQPFTFEIATVLTEAPQVGGDAATPRELPTAVPAVTRRVVPNTPPPAPTSRPPEPARRMPPPPSDESGVALATSPRGPRDVAAPIDLADAGNDPDRFDRRTAPIAPPSFLLEPGSGATGSRPLIAGDSTDQGPLVMHMPASAEQFAAPAPTPTPEVAVAPVIDEPSETAEAAEAPTGDTPSPRAVLAHYVVQKGDTLTKIAQHHYGSRRPEVLKALYDANRGVLPNQDTVLVGKELLVPVLEMGDGPPLPQALAEVTDSPAAASREARADAPPALEAPAPEAPKVELAIHAVPQEQEVAASEPAAEETAPASERDVAEADNDAPDLHVVAARETLSKIARRHYGSDAKPVLDAIHAANRGRIRDQNGLVVGTKLVLPDLTAAAKSPRSSRSSGPTGSTNSSARPGSALLARTPEPAAGTNASRRKGGSAKAHSEWYELQPGDVYTTVAAKKLGTSKRWSDLAELNKDIFPDASRIRPGVRIRIPKSARAEAKPASAPALRRTETR